MRFSAILALLVSLLATHLPAERVPMILRDDIEIPTLPKFTPLPPLDEELSEKLRIIVEEAGLAEMAPADKSPDGKDEWSSICLVDLSDIDNPRVAGWKAENFVYPASTVKMYAMGEAIRHVVAGNMTLEDVHAIKPHNVREGSLPKPGQEMSLSEIIRLTIQYSDNTTANELIDIADRQRVSALMHAMGCQGSELTRKYLSRDLEDEGYANVRGTETSALHLATFLWAVETGAIGGGKGRGLIKGYLAMNEKGRFFRGLPESATIFSKTGWWNIYTSEAAIVEDGGKRYILCALTVYPTAVADERLARLAGAVHQLLDSD
jgi:beta-lactamase class A